MSTIHVFIYGSLLPGQSNHHVVSRYVQSCEEGMIGGRLVDYGPYPALVRDDLSAQLSSAVRGQWIAVSREGLAAMDILEEFFGMEERNDYDRVWISDLNVPDRQGWVYVWESDRGYPSIPESYWPDYRRGK